MSLRARVVGALEERLALMAPARRERLALASRALAAGGGRGKLRMHRRRLR